MFILMGGIGCIIYIIYFLHTPLTKKINKPLYKIKIKTKGCGEDTLKCMVVGDSLKLKYNPHPSISYKIIKNEKVIY